MHKGESAALISWCLLTIVSSCCLDVVSRSFLVWVIAGLAASGSGGSGQLLSHLSSGNVMMATEPRSLPSLGEAPDLLVTPPSP